MMCQYCDGSTLLIDGNDWGGTLTVSIERTKTRFYLEADYACSDDAYDAHDFTTIHYCPMCGRELVGNREALGVDE